ncbi:hypothetical protein OQA88_3595 [Cercophora sp. LCS_1]
MATVRILLAVLLLLRPIFGQYTAYNYGIDVSQHIKRQMAQPLVVRGDSSGAVRLRREIRELEQDSDLWTLYILGLSMMQFQDQTLPNSWYGLTGSLHPRESIILKRGYCTHSSVLFPTWHRPYLVLYEQVLYGLIQTIATLWPPGKDRDRYQAAAARFRIPYWDWAASPPSGQSVLPASVGGNPYVDVAGPSGVQRIANPLFSYTFKPLNSTAMLWAPWNLWTSTLRSPVTTDNTARSNNSLVARNFDQNLPTISQRLYILFSNYDNYTTFSNNAWIPLINNASYDSLESLHDTIHNLAGGGGLGQPNAQGGHMSYIPYSAFDPIFFLHHTNVDRIFAIWQAINPNSWVQPQSAALPSYTTSKGQVQDSATALTPFFAGDDGIFWTSDSVRDHRIFGYTYSEVQASLNSSRKASAHVRKAINRLYGASSPASLFINEAKASSLQRARPRKASAVWGVKQTDTDIGSRYREWIANIRVSKQALDEPFAVHLFVGDVPLQPQDWSFAKSHVGMVGVFSSRNMYGAMEGLAVSGTVPLTKTLVDKIMANELATLDSQDVEKYLRAHLKRRVLTASGKVYDARTIETLEVKIVSSVVKAPETEEELPQWGKVESHFALS